MQFDPENHIVKLCAEGMGREGETDEAARLFQQAWNEATNNYEKFIAAHYVARHQKTIAEKLTWDKTSLQLARQIKDRDIKQAFPSLYLNIAKGFEDLGDLPNATENYEQALKFSASLPDDGYSKMIRSGIANGMGRVRRLGIIGS